MDVDEGNTLTNSGAESSVGQRSMSEIRRSSMINPSDNEEKE